MVIPLEITGTWLRNPSVERDYQLVVEESTRGIGFHQELLAQAQQLIYTTNVNF
jgi:hypothetical protein